MKKYLLVFTILSIISITSCKNEIKNGDSEVMAPEDSNVLGNDVNTPQIACYKYTSAKDTVLIQMERMNDEVAGTLSYNYYEKDKNDGTFEGKIVGDTLFATYTFGAEGKTSVREIMFIEKGNKLIEGFGEVEEIDGKMKFKKNTKFNFNSLMPLAQIDCDGN
ncbi:hypothetical protein A7A78_07175 [Aequorivita soesokkakensis]|uniref:Lipoprotein n=1 Tax=Aequorivita soesokkakensis TaxID=1385699 RepID=A0A1A9LAN1_9FLAO|nr:hypothetical protein [Aequorivita soesokkakensis]OAD90320.1 hypothetical protein A7A78_07175 [Aequorivita soesokkakensis]